MGAKLNNFVFQPPKVSNSDRPTILFSHGNAEDIGMHVNFFLHVSQVWNVNFFSYEYTGYGISKGTPSEKHVYADIEAAYIHLVNKWKIPPSKIILYGRSLGTGPSIHLAQHHPVAGVILQSPLTSIHRIVINFKYSIFGDMFRNIDKIEKVNCPIFIIHGMRDEIVPFSHGVALYNAAPAPVTPYWLEDAGHNDIEAVGREDFFLNVRRFIEFILSRNVQEESMKVPVGDQECKIPRTRELLA